MPGSDGKLHPRQIIMQSVSTILFLMLTWNLSLAQQFNLDSSKFKVGDVYISNPKILFEFANWSIKNESYAHLDRIADFLISHDSLVIEIGVHTDSRESDWSSRRLDVKRAESIQEYLNNKGVELDRLTAQGYGKTVLIISDIEIEKMQTAQEREEAHAVNRRTEFKIIEVKNSREQIKK